MGIAFLQFSSFWVLNSHGLRYSFRHPLDVTVSTTFAECVSQNAKIKTIVFYIWMTSTLKQHIMSTLWQNKHTEIHMKIVITVRIVQCYYLINMCKCVIIVDKWRYSILFVSHITLRAYIYETLHTALDVKLIHFIESRIESHLTYLYIKLDMFSFSFHCNICIA